MKKGLPPLLLAGVALASLEIVVTLWRGHRLFLTLGERLEFALASLTVLTLCVVLLGGLIGSALDPAARLNRLLLSVAAAALGGWALWLLSAGRRVRDLPARPWIVGLSALGVGFACFGLLQLARRVSTSSSRPLRWGLGAGAALAVAGCLALDLLVLPRGYPAFHRGLLVLAVVAAALGASSLELRVSAPRAQRALLATTLLLPLLAPLALAHLSAQPNASYAVVEQAPWTSKLLRPFLVRSAAPLPSVPSPASAAPPQSSRAGVDLRDRDTLLITVDALRADVLSALGGNGLTPELDRLAQDALVFRRAYTPAPHTSYALASLLTAKFLKPVVELAGAPARHPTLPDLLRRFSYRTAAFYPPAIFFVDGARFRGLAERGFGFEYRKEMFASADARVEQLEAYLAGAAPGHPLFVWVHLFEPHEPYEPPEAFRREASARGRYDGEVAYCDQAIGRLIRLFRARSPGATVIVSADHGEEFGEHGGSYHGSTLFDEQVRVPLLWSSPGVVAPGVSDVPVELIDVGSTILSTAGVARDARMRGDDLSAVLGGDPSAGPRFAFASVEERHMVTDGQFKLLCSVREAHCQLFDLRADPGEQQNLATQRVDLVERMRGELFAFLGSIAQREVMAVRDHVAFPEPLVRARLFAPGAGPDLLPLLSDARPAVRAAAARSLGELGVSSALPVLERLRSGDPDREVRAEAAIAALWLGGATLDDVTPLLRASVPAAGVDDGLARPRRAALALATLRAPAALPVLAELAGDASAQEADRLRAVEALGGFGGAAAAAAALIAALEDVRLREAAARALGRSGGAQAARALLAQLEQERYEPARRAEAEALVALGDRRVLPLLARFLGTESSVPGGVRLLAQLDALDGPRARGALLRAARARAGEWRCGERGCAPVSDARIVLPGKLPAGRGALRITLWIGDAEPDALLQVGGVSFRLKGGEQQLSFTRPRWQGPQQLELASASRVELMGWVAVPEAAEIPPPAPEPWDAGADTPAAASEHELGTQQNAEAGP
jgi:arylsulfatase A-like enzyme/HEAT repeat protein